jgi:predicted RNA-binding protein YlqC (UPF0109 family)
MTQQSADVRALVEQIAKALVDEPDQVSVNHLEGDVLELTVAANDVGKVIGAKGRVARALRALISAAGIRLQKRFTLEILE